MQLVDRSCRQQFCLQKQIFIIITVHWKQTKCAYDDHTLNKVHERTLFVVFQLFALPPISMKSYVHTQFKLVNWIAEK